MSGFKCIKSEVVSHNGSVKLLTNIKYIDDSQILYCDHVNDDDLDETFNNGEDTSSEKVIIHKKLLFIKSQKFVILKNTFKNKKVTITVLRD